MMTQITHAFSLKFSALLVFTILLTSASAVMAASTHTLKGALNTPIGVGPTSIVTGDFNGDGKLDTATSNLVGHAVGVVFGDGSGGFLPATSYLVSNQPAQIVAGQFSNDSFLDLVTVNQGASNINLLTNNGAGSFTVTTYTTVFVANSIAAGDINNDGRIDLVVAGHVANLIGVMLANPGGGFNAPILTEIPSAGITSVAVGLLNGDLNLDLVVTNSSLNRISILTGNGSGGLSSPVHFSTGANSAPNRLQVGDFNSDLKLDVIVTLQQPPRVVFMAGDGLGTVAAPVNLNLASITDTFSSLFLHDVNADNKLDILLTGYASNYLRILFGNGTGGVTLEKQFMLSKQPRSVAAGDFNGDGLVDLPGVSDGVGVITMLLNQGGGDFITPKILTSDIGPIVFADLNVDGKQDMLVDSNQPAARGVRFGNGDGTFQAPVAFTYPNRFTDLIVGDVNNDNKPDIISSGGAGISVNLNNGSGGFPSPINISTSIGKLGLGDFDDDGMVDLVMGISSVSSPNIRIYKGDGAGNFALQAGDTVNAGISALTVADFNNDGDPDLYLHINDGTFLVKLRNGVNSFGPPVGLNSGGCTAFGSLYVNETPIAADFNHDGNLDVTAPSNCGNGTNFAVYFGDGLGGFSLGGNFLNAPIATGSRAADFNGDGNLDIGSICFGEYAVAYGDGAGQFTVTRYAVGGATNTAAVAEITSDGLPDVAFMGVGGLPGTYALLSRTLARGGVTADFDGDGKTDLSVFRPSNGTWYVLRSSDNTFYGVQFGLNGDRPVPGDYDGDGRTDLAVFRNGDWYLLRSTDGGFGSFHHGSPGDIPVPADYDGDGMTNFAVFRPSTGYWYPSTDPATNYGAVQWGASGDIPTPADYDGDGRAEISVFRPSAGTWYQLRTSSGFFQIQHGINGDKPVAVDYDGDGRANIAVFRPASGTWYRSTDPATNYSAIQWGASTDALVPGYYDADNQADVAIYRDGTWYIFYSSTQNYSFFYFGTTGDIPIPSAFVP